MSGEGSRPRRFGWQIIAVAASLLLAIYFVGRMVPGGIRDVSSSLVEQEILDSHLRSLMPGHLVDLQSADQFTVKPWFNGKLDYSPPVMDFAQHGFALTGGRLDSVNGRSVAALTYKRRQHVINVWAWPVPEQLEAIGAGITKTLRQGYNLMHWRGAGMEWWAASDLNAAELETFVNLLRGASAPAKP